MRPVHLRLTPSSHFSVCKDVGSLSIPRRSGLGYAGVLAEFKLSKSSYVWTSCVCELHKCFFMGMEETKIELQFLFYFKFGNKTRCAFEVCVFMRSVLVL